MAQTAWVGSPFTTTDSRRPSNVSHSRQRFRPTDLLSLAIPDPTAIERQRQVEQGDHNGPRRTPRGQFDSIELSSTVYADLSLILAL
jgi:hypothetical protein